MPAYLTPTLLRTTCLDILQTIYLKLWNDRSFRSNDIHSSGVNILLSYLFGQSHYRHSGELNDSDRYLLSTNNNHDLIADSAILAEIRAEYSTIPVDPEEIPGLYSAIKGYTLTDNGNGRPALLKGRDRRKKGIYYTPEAISKFIVHETITPLVRKTSLNDLKCIRVCDPAMGTGVFLLEAARKLTKALIERSGETGNAAWSEWYRYVVNNCIFGMDKDETAVRIARLNFAGTAETAPDRLRNLITVDGLLDKLPDGWVFDAVIGNPPWLTYGLRSVKRIPEGLAKLYNERFPESAEYKISAYTLFIERALTITAQGGYHGFVVPDSWLQGRYFSKIRTLLVSKNVFHRLVLIKKDFWKGLNIGRCVVYVVQKRAPDNLNGTIPASIVERPEELSGAGKSSVALSLTRINRRVRRRIAIYPDENSRDIVEKMEDTGDKLGSHLRFYSGLIGKKGKQSIVIANVPKEHRNCRYGKLIESGKNLQQNKFIYTGRYIEQRPELYKSGYDVQKYRNPKLFVNQTGYDLKACYDDQGFFCLNNIHIAYPVRENTDLIFYAALLNSRIMKFYYRVMSMEPGRALAQTDIDFLLLLPHGTDKGIMENIKNTIHKHVQKKIACHDSDHVEYICDIPGAVKKDLEYCFMEWYGIPVKKTSITFS